MDVIQIYVTVNLFTAVIFYNNLTLNKLFNSKNLLCYYLLLQIYVYGFPTCTNCYEYTREHKLYKS